MCSGAPGCSALMGAERHPWGGGGITLSESPPLAPVRSPAGPGQGFCSLPGLCKPLPSSCLLSPPGHDDTINLGKPGKHNKQLSDSIDCFEPSCSLPWWEVGAVTPSVSPPATPPSLPGTLPARSSLYGLAVIIPSHSSS